MAFFGKLVIVLVLIHNIRGLFGAELRSSIVGGHDAEKHKWPWMVHVNISDGNNNRRCGGTLLNKHWVLTAASCWEGDREKLWDRSMVWIGSHNLKTATKETTKYKAIKRVQFDPQYKKQSVGYVNDIAVVQLKGEVERSKWIKYVSLPSANYVFGPSSDCTIIGWGNIETADPLPHPETLQELKIPIIPHSVCKKTYPDLTPNMLCAGDLVNGKKDACKGDYGGPLMCLVDGSYVQVGIMSYGSPKGCGLPGGPGVYTSVSKYLRFINSYIHQGEEASAEL